MSAGKKNDSFPFKPYDEGGDSEATTLNTDFKIVHYHLLYCLIWGIN